MRDSYVCRWIVRSWWIQFGTYLACSVLYAAFVPVLQLDSLQLELDPARHTASTPGLGTAPPPRVYYPRLISRP